MKLNEKIIEVIENNGFNYNAVMEHDNKFYIELYQDTPAGEDWNVIIWFDGSDNGFIDSFRRYSESFDVDEETEILVESRGKHGIPSSISLLVKDAEWKKETLENTLKDLENIDNNNIVTLFVLDSVNDRDKPIIYVIPLDRQLEVEKLAKSIITENFDDAEYEFERLLNKNYIDFEWMGMIDSIVNRQKDWIDDKIPRVIVG